MGESGHQVMQYEDKEVWTGSLHDGSVAVVPFNIVTTSASITAKWNDISYNPISQLQDEISGHTRTWAI